LGIVPGGVRGGPFVERGIISRPDILDWMEVPTTVGRRQRGTIGERWDPRKLRRIREDGWFRQHEGELIAAARRKVAVAASKAATAKMGAAPASKTSESEYDVAIRRSGAIVARAMELLRDLDRSSAPHPK